MRPQIGIEAFHPHDILTFPVDVNSILLISP
jgi:hypothetical protein